MKKRIYKKRCTEITWSTLEPDDKNYEISEHYLFYVGKRYNRVQKLAEKLGYIKKSREDLGTDYLKLTKALREGTLEEMFDDEE